MSLVTRTVNDTAATVDGYGFPPASSFGLTVGITYGTCPEFSAVDRLGNLFAFADVLAGDLLRFFSGPTVYRISGISDLGLLLQDSIPSNTSKAGFEVLSAAALQYQVLHDRLATYMASRMLLKLNKMDVDLSALDYALGLALLPGQNLAPSRNQAKKIAADLLSILTTNPRRADEYTTVPPVAPDNLELILSAYSVQSIPALDSYIDALLERKYDRAADLLTGADVAGFFGTNEETGSYAGAVASASRKVLKDLPRYPTLQHQAQQSNLQARIITESSDPETDLSDTEGLRTVED